MQKDFCENWGGGGGGKTTTEINSIKFLSIFLIMNATFV